MSRSLTGLVLLALGVVFALLGMLVLNGLSGAVALVAAVVCLTGGTLLFGVSRRAGPPEQSTP